MLSRQMIKTSKGSPPSDSFFPVDPPQPNPHILPPAGMARLSSLETAPGNPEQALGSGLQVWLPSWRQTRAAPTPRVGATLLPPGSSGQEDTAASPHSHSRAQKALFLSGRPGPATSSEPSMRSPPETNLQPRWAPDCSPGEPALRPATALCSWKVERRACVQSKCYFPGAFWGEGE